MAKVKRNLGACASCVRRPATHVARHGAYRDLGLCAQCHEGPRPNEYGRPQSQKGSK